MADTPSFDEIEDVGQQASPAPQPAEQTQSFDSIEEAPSLDSIQDVSPEKAASAQKYGTPEQQVITALEGAGRGATFGLSTKAETMMGVDPKDIIARQNENPWIAAGSEAAGTIGSMAVPGVGEGWLLAKAGKLAIPIAKDASVLSKAGRLALRGMGETMGMASGDEVSDMFLDKGHDAAAVASHIVKAGAAGFILGGGFGASGAALEKIHDPAVGEYLDDFSIGLGHAATNSGSSSMKLSDIIAEEGGKVPPGVKHGEKVYDALTHNLGKQIVKQGAGIGSGIISGLIQHGLGIGVDAGVPIDTMAYKIIADTIDPYSSKLASKFTNKIAVPVMLQAIKTGDSAGITRTMDYATKAASGSKMINSSLDSLFKVGGEKAMNYEINEKDNDKLDKHIEQGGINQQIDDLRNQQEMPGYAEGGKVEAKPINPDSNLSKLYPAQHMMMTAAKGRVSNYLNSLRPAPNTNKMMFDNEYKDPAKEKTYRDALHVANQPLSVLQHIQKGTLQAEHVKHLNSMYPEVHDHLAKKITERLVDHQDEETKPSYKTRQGLSLFLGSSLDSTTTPMAIQAAQSVFAPKPAPQQPPAKNKKGTGSLSKVSDAYQTPEQSRDKRMNKD
jgi:hypothetical protein